MPKVSKTQIVTRIPEHKILTAQRVAKRAESLQVKLKEAFEAYEKNDDFGELMLALKGATAFKGFTQLARETGLSRQYLYDLLTKNGNPTVKVLDAVLKVYGYKMTFEAVK